LLLFTSRTAGRVCFSCSRYLPLTHSSVEPKSLEETDEKLVVRLGLTYGVLRRLGFSDAIVDECLKAIPGVDVDEAYEWVSVCYSPKSFKH
jgi:hypothetical protein